MVRPACPRLWFSPLLLAACSSEPPAGALDGRWGNRMVEVVAQPRLVELHLPCSTRARFRGPVLPDDEGRFRLIGQAVHFYGSYRVELAGQIDGARLRIILTRIYYDGGTETSDEELRAGVEPDYPGVVCAG